MSDSQAVPGTPVAVPPAVEAPPPPPVVPEWLPDPPGFPLFWSLWTAVQALQSPVAAMRRILQSRANSLRALWGGLAAVVVLGGFFGFIFGLASGGRTWAFYDAHRIPIAFLAGLSAAFFPFYLMSGFFRFPLKVVQAAALLLHVLVMVLVVIVSFSLFTLLVGLVTWGAGFPVSWITYFFIGLALSVAAVSFSRGIRGVFGLKTGGNIAGLVFLLLFMALSLSAVSFGPYWGDDYTSMMQRFLAGKPG